MENRKLTGAKRFRLGSEGRLSRRQVVVLQVEESYDHCTPCGPSFDTRTYTHWRDATLEDLTLEHSDKGGFQ
jgi:hypothetical protein